MLNLWKCLCLLSLKLSNWISSQAGTGTVEEGKEGSCATHHRESLCQVHHKLSYSTFHYMTTFTAATKAAEGRRWKGHQRTGRNKKGSSCDTLESSGNRSGRTDLWQDEGRWRQLLQETGGMWTCCGLYLPQATATGLDQAITFLSFNCIYSSWWGWIDEQTWWCLLGKCSMVLLSLHLRYGNTK